MTQSPEKRMISGRQWSSGSETAAESGKRKAESGCRLEPFRAGVRSEGSGKGRKGDR